MNYIGSKFSLLSHIERMLDKHGVPRSGIALDVFAGTGAVAQFLKRRGHITYANDWQRYSYLTCVALIEFNALPTFEEVAEFCPTDAQSVIGYLNALLGTEGSFTDTYCQAGSGGRQYFSAENGRRIQAIRDQIESWHGQGHLSDKKKAWLTACLIEAADKVANTASVYGAYLKHIKRSAALPLKLRALEPIPSSEPASAHRAFCGDSTAIVRQLADERITLAYIDPPYNARQYNSNYHILETIARWDIGSFEARGVTGLRQKGENRSPYCSRTKAGPAFRDLLGALNADYVLFSYSNEGLVSKAALTDMFTENYQWHDFVEIPYKRFRADVDGENRVYDGDSTLEYLILGAKKPISEASISLDCDLVGLSLEETRLLAVP
ncbi:MAG: DNA adenine methylase [Armatimonadota bacterium]